MSTFDAISVWMFDPFCFTPWYTAELTSALLATRAKVRLICGTLPKEPQYFVSKGLRPEIKLQVLSPLQTGSMKRLNRPLRLAQAVATTRALVRQLQRSEEPLPDVLHMQQLPMLDHGFRSDFALLNAARRAGVRTVHTVHNILPHAAPERSREIYRELYHQVDHLICHSENARGELVAEFGISPEKVTILPHGPLFAPLSPSTAEDKEQARQHLGLSGHRPIVLYQGILSDYKGLDVLLDAWHQLRRQIALFREPPLLLIVGTGAADIESRIHNAVSKRGSSVRAELRYIPAEELPRFYHSADVLVYPYRSITTSGALLTGLTYRKPIVASDLCSFHEYLVDGDNALLAQAGSATDLARAMGLLFDEWLSAECGDPALNNRLYQRLTLGAMQNRQRYVGWDSIAKGTCLLYEALLQDRQPILI